MGRHVNDSRGLLWMPCFPVPTGWTLAVSVVNGYGLNPSTTESGVPPSTHPYWSPSIGLTRCEREKVRTESTLHLVPGFWCYAASVADGAISIWAARLPVETETRPGSDWTQLYYLVEMQRSHQPFPHQSVGNTCECREGEKSQPIKAPPNTPRRKNTTSGSTLQKKR